MELIKNCIFGFLAAEFVIVIISLLLLLDPEGLPWVFLMIGSVVNVVLTFNTYLYIRYGKGK